MRDELRGLDNWILGTHIKDDPRSPYYTGPEDCDDTGFTSCSNGKCGRCDACEEALERQAEAKYEAMQEEQIDERWGEG